MAEVEENPYSSAYVYKIINSGNTEVYVGSSFNTPALRMKGHREKSQSRTSIFYQAIRDIGFHNFEMVILEQYPCNNNDELRTREEFYRKQLNSSYNMRQCVITDEERKTKNQGYERVNRLERNARTLKIKQIKARVERVQYEADKLAGIVNITLYCVTCKRKFSTSEGLLVHNKSKFHHKKLTVSDVSTRSEFYCEVCDMSLSSVRILDTHRNSSYHYNQAGIELDDRTFRCEVCNVGFRTESNLRLHNTGARHLKRMTDLALPN